MKINFINYVNTLGYSNDEKKNFELNFDILLKYEENNFFTTQDIRKLLDISILNKYNPVNHPFYADGTTNDGIIFQILLDIERFYKNVRKFSEIEIFFPITTCSKGIKFYKTGNTPTIHLAVYKKEGIYSSKNLIGNSEELLELNANTSNHFVYFKTVYVNGEKISGKFWFEVKYSTGEHHAGTRCNIHIPAVREEIWENCYAKYGRFYLVSAHVSKDHESINLVISKIPKGFPFKVVHFLEGIEPKIATGRIDKIYVTLDNNSIINQTGDKAIDNIIEKFKYQNNEFYFDDVLYKGLNIQDINAYIDNILKFDNTIVRNFKEVEDTMIVINESRKPKAINKLFIGPPGTGKSYEINQELKDIDKSLYERITFYQDYDNSDFVGSILPVMTDKGIDYKFVPGPITRMIEKAISNPNVMHYLVIEEMSRGNCGAIFGDIFQLLDRNDNHESVYGINNQLMEKEIYGTVGANQIIIPNNLTIYGTVNSSDQNVFPMDTAFMRRFNQKYISTELTDIALRDTLLDIDINGTHWADLYQILNEFIIHKDYCGLSEDKQIGPFFITNQDEGYLTKIFRYIHHDIDRVSNGNTIIDPEINGFSKVVKKIEEGNNVYSKDFIDFMNNYGK